MQDKSDIEISSEHAIGQLKAYEAGSLQILLRPAFELVVNYPSQTTPEDVYQLQCRWVDAGNSCGWEKALPTYERMVAEVHSPIWKALGDGVGGHDALGIPHPPFFADGWKFGWRPMDRDEWDELKTSCQP